MEEYLISLLKEYGYIILYLWSILEGETGLVMAGLLSYSGDMNLYLSIFIAGLGGFTGDQIYFYIGRLNKKYIRKKLQSQRRKFALAKLLLDKYGWYIIFIQRYMYGLRTIIPMSIGTTDFNAKKFALVNLISAWMWAAITITPVYIYGKEILEFLSVVKEYWYVALALGIILLGSLYIYFDKTTSTKKRKKRKVND